ncbi:general substrate transporter [Lipomyces japonicus]|uniref:general substrate transporter n=1 Tax=Lipomyces japonicus TaxID=56871 RepID=UPI0034CD2295
MAATAATADANILEKQNLDHVEYDNNLATAYTGKNLVEDSKDYDDIEHQLTPREALKLYPKAIAWSLIISLTVVMEGYDMNLIGNFYAYDTFKAKYGEYHAGTGYQVTAPWQAALSNGPTIGTFIGGLINGYVSTRFGHRRVLIVSLVFMAAFIFITFFAPTVQVLFVGELLCGIPWGIFATIGPAYASEVCPMVLRGYLTSYINMCWAIGQLISAGVLQGLQSRTDEWGYRIPFAVQWVWPLPILVAVLFAPESPWWLVRTGRLADAERSVSRLSSKNAPSTARQTVAMMVHTNKLELEIETSQSYLACFKGTDLRRTEIACFIMAGQVMSGTTFAYSPTYFFTLAGLSAGDAYKMNLGGTGVAFCGTVFSWFVMTRFGRRSIYVGGMTIMFALLLLIGFLAIPKNQSGVIWGQAAICFLWLATYSSTVGPIGWTIPAEISSTRLRQNSVVLARNFYYIIQIIANVIEPYMINPTEGDWKGKTAFFWAGTAFVTVVWAYFRLPESKGRTYAELDIMFHNHVSARKFNDYVVDPYSSDKPLDQVGRDKEGKAT